MRGALECWKTWAHALNPFEFTKSATYFWVGETILNAEGADALAEAITPLAESQGPKAFCRQVDAVLAYSAVARLHQISAPTQLLWGTEEKLVLENHQRALLEGIPDVRLVRIEGAGHSPNFEQPDAFNAALATFLATVS